MDEPRVVKNLKEFYEIESGAFARYCHTININAQ